MKRIMNANTNEVMYIFDMDLNLKHGTLVRQDQGGGPPVTDQNLLNLALLDATTLQVSTCSSFFRG